MKIIMLQTRYGSEDGFVVRRFLQNNEYEIADSLAHQFIRSGISRHPAGDKPLVFTPQHVRGDNL
jgi:hypothetical protein